MKFSIIYSITISIDTVVFNYIPHIWFTHTTGMTHIKKFGIIKEWKQNMAAMTGREK
jgi:hypothetical protein